MYCDVFMGAQVLRRGVHGCEEGGGARSGVFMAVGRVRRGHVMACVEVQRHAAGL